MEGKDGGSPAPNLPWSVAVPSVAILICYIGDFSFSFFFVDCRVEKYRPKNLEDLISHKEIISTSELDFLILMMFHISDPLRGQGSWHFELHI